MEQFNRDCQHGQITKSGERGCVLYRIPSGRNIEVSFFEPQAYGLKIRAGEVIGGGWIGISKGRSANLVLLKESSDDLYGRWAVCEIGIMALADTRKLIGRFGLTRETIVPFGFKDAYFYDQIQYATGVMHAFTYNFIDDVADFFRAASTRGLEMSYLSRLPATLGSRTITFGLLHLPHARSSSIYSHREKV